MTYQTIHLTLSATIAGETREVACKGHIFEGQTAPRNMISVECVGAFRKNGGKVWTSGITFWAQPDGSWKLARNEVFLNRNGYSLVAWADKATKNQSEHNSAYQAH